MVCPEITHFAYRTHSLIFDYPSSYFNKNVEWTKDHDIQLAKILVSKSYRFKPRTV